MAKTVVFEGLVKRSAVLEWEMPVPVKGASVMREAIEKLESIEGKWCRVTIKVLPKRTGGK